jgi:putative transcriptional regulator
MKNEIRVFRAKLKMKQSELAEKTGLSLATISNVESEKRDPNLVTMVKIAAAFNVGVEDVFTGLKDLVKEQGE